MSTTQRYLHLAGVVFRDEADALERRLLGAGHNGTVPAAGKSTPGVAGSEVFVSPVDSRRG
ncbi:MAG: hypothetical protein H0V45_09820, partial [Actinobacteria bacterium]|nr:hypothetical protein [Actinomycetota bacterium]